MPALGTDARALVRLLLYSNVIDIRGLIATTSVHQKTRVVPDSIRRVIAAYGKARSNLVQHEAGYPEAGALLARVKQGSRSTSSKGTARWVRCIPTSPTAWKETRRPGWR